MQMTTNESNAFSPSTIEDWEAKLMDAWRIADSFSIEEPEIIFAHHKAALEVIDKLQHALRRAVQ